MESRKVSLLLVVLMVLSLAPSLHHPWVSGATTVTLDGQALAWDLVNLTWTPYDGAKAYEIYRATDPDVLLSPSHLIVTVNWSSYPQYEPGTTYYQGDIVEYNGQIWQAKYWTQSAPGGDAWTLLGNATPTTNYLDQWNLTANTTYYYAVVPVLADGSKASPSNTLIITTPAQPYRVVVYYISWARYAREFYVSDIPWDKVTHVLYAFLKPNQDGTISLYDSYGDELNLEDLKKYKEKYPQVKVLISVGGWTLSTYFSDIAADPVKRQTFAESALEYLRKYNLDGLDIDWEYPGGGGLETNHVSPDDGQNFVLLLKTVREVFNQAELEDHKDYLLTAAVSADPVKAGRINWTEASKYLDFIDVMTYDYHGAWENITGHNAPLYADPNAPYTDPNIKWNFNVNASIQWYIQHVPDKTKIVLGLPFYSRSFANVPSTNNGLYQPFSGTPDGTWGPASETYGVMDYWDVADKNQTADYNYYWDNVAMVAWLYSPTYKVFITFDDPRAIGIKVDYMLKNGIGGVMVWEITADRKPGTNDHPLLDTVLTHLKEQPPAWIPDTYYLGATAPANLTVPEPSYDNSTSSGGVSNTTDNTTTSNTTESNTTTGGTTNTTDNSTSSGSVDNTTTSNTTDTGSSNTTENQTETNPPSNTTDNTTSSNTTETGTSNTTNNLTLVKPGAISVKITDWGSTQYDVTLDLGGTYNWIVKVKLVAGSSISSYWSVDKTEQDGWVIFTPKSWNLGPTASFGFIATGSKPVEQMILEINGEIWDVWPANSTVPATNESVGANNTSDNTTSSNTTETTNTTTGNTTDNSTSSGEVSNTTDNTTTSNTTETGTSNTTSNTTENTTSSNTTTSNTTETGTSNTTSNLTLVKPGAISVTINDWGDTEYDVTLDLGGTYDWVLKVKLVNGSTIKSYWSANKAEVDGYVVFTPVSWNLGPTASFGFIATGSKPVEQMILEINGEIWDVWPEGSSVSTGDQSTDTGTTNTTNTTESGGTSNTTESNTTAGGTTNTTTGNTTYIPAGPGLPEHFFAPYIDMTLTSVHKPLVEYYNLTGTPYFTLAFIIYSSAYGPSWGGALPLDTYVNEVAELRKAGGDVIIAFGGAVGPYLCQQTQDAQQLADWYIQIADMYNATYFDFDIESSIDANLLADALLIVQQQRPNIKFSFTLPSDPGAGLVGAGYSIIQTMVQKGVNIDRVNPMTMDYYWTPANAQNAISVAQHVFTQLQQLYPNKTDAEIWGMIGLTPMIGVNDDKSVFTLTDAQELVDWAVQQGIRSLAFWSVDRDHPGPEGEVSPLHRGTSDPDWAYSHVFVQFMTAFSSYSAPSQVAVTAI